jgi:formylglycine-generating enzyme required for sulfatase activity
MNVMRTINRAVVSAVLVIGLIRTTGAAAQAVPGEAFQDCAGCPEMMILPPGSFRMGSDRVDAMRGGEMRPQGPVRNVTIPAPIAVGRYEISNQQYGAFVAATGRPAQSCRAWGLAEDQLGLNWRDPGYGRLVRDEEPVVCVYWFDAQAYVRWLGDVTGKAYRLLTESEWEYAASGGVSTTWPWGEDPAGICDHGNVLDQDGAAQLASGRSTTKAMAAACRDGYPGVAPLGRYQPNEFGLYDMVGNVWEWVQDCSLTLYPDAPIDGSAVEVDGECEKRAVRGGSWRTRLDRQRPTFRGRDPAATAYNLFGFRVARDVD